MQTADQKIASDVTARICHDLISPIGAISNGLELLTLSGQANSPELDLIVESVQNANAKIRFLRVAFGDANSGGDISRNQFIDLIKGCYTDNRYAFSYEISDMLARPHAKLLLLVVLTAEKIMPFGGKISFEQTPDRLCVHLGGTDLKTNTFIDCHSNQFIENPSPTHIHLQLAQNLVELHPFEMCATQTDTGLSLDFMF